MKLWNALKRRSRSAADTVGRYQEASVYAQAGGREQALDILRTQDVSVDIPSKLVVLVQGAEFPEEMRSYALNMAQGLGYEILALNTAPIRRETWNFLDLEHHQVRREFQASASLQFQAFEQEALSCNVSIEHQVKFLDKEEALDEIQKTFSRVEFVISNAEPIQPRQERHAQRPRAVDEICVYTLA